MNTKTISILLLLVLSVHSQVSFALGTEMGGIVSSIRGSEEQSFIDAVNADKTSTVVRITASGTVELSWTTPFSLWGKIGYAQRGFIMSNHVSQVEILFGNFEFAVLPSFRFIDTDNFGAQLFLGSTLGINLNAEEIYSTGESNDISASLAKASLALNYGVLFSIPVKRIELQTTAQYSHQLTIFFNKNTHRITPHGFTFVVGFTVPLK